MKKIMMRAWEIARAAATIYGEKASSYIAEALRMAWEEEKGETREQKLEKLGFKRWQKNGMDRFYINATKLGLEYTTYKTGNVCSAWFRGDAISNCEARRMLSAKTYIDAKDWTLHCDHYMLSDAARELMAKAM